MHLLVWLWLWLGTAWSSKLEMVDNGYNGLVIGISPDIEEAEGHLLLPALKKMIERASKLLYRATYKRAFFRQVKILIPKHWNRMNFMDVEDATTENYQDSHIQVRDDTVEKSSIPYLVQPGGCGEPGNVIIFSTKHLTGSQWYGRPGKLLLLLWARYRWGVFDEIGYDNDPKYPPFYQSVSSGGGSYKPTYCVNIDLKGTLRNKLGKKCKEGPDGLPDKNCRFKAIRNQKPSSSFMVFPDLRFKTINEFCNESTHVADAPTKQNDKCGHQSVWEVILQHGDFKDGANPARTQPLEEQQSITVVQMVDASFALILDYSGSMSTNDRILKQQEHAQRWLLHSVATGSYVTIIRFSSGPAIILANLTKITDENSRKSLAVMIPLNNDGGTSIGSGLIAAIQELSGKANKNIMLITDGEENESPYISDVLQELVQANICVITVAVSVQADDKLENLAQATGCQSYVVNDVDTSNMFETAFEASAKRQPTKEEHIQDIKIYESPTISPATVNVTDRFYVDNTVGKNLLLLIKSDQSSQYIKEPTLIDPSGAMVKAKELDDISNTWIFSVPVAKVGWWQWEADILGGPSSYVKATATAQQRDPNVPPITARVLEMAPTTGIDAVQQNVKLYIEVKQGTNPVIGAEVKALVTQPGGLINVPPDEYLLKDNGVGADAMKGDGIYSGYMTKFNGTGRYAIKALVTGTNSTLVNVITPSSGTRRKRSSSRKGKPKPSLCCGSFVPLDNSTARLTGNFRRVNGAPALKITKAPAADQDVLPPCRVLDLYVKSVALSSSSKGSSSILLTWTTPGDDLDQGTGPCLHQIAVGVSTYEFRLSSAWTHLKDADFNKAPPGFLVVLNKKDSDGIFVECGREVSLQVSFKTHLRYNKVYFVALRTKDDVNNPSEVSNIAQFTLEEKLEMPEWAVKKSHMMRESSAYFESIRSKD